MSSLCSEAWERRERFGTKGHNSGRERAQMGLTVGGEDLQARGEIAVEDRL